MWAAMARLQSTGAMKNIYERGAVDIAWLCCVIVGIVCTQQR